MSMTVKTTPEAVRKIGRWALFTLHWRAKIFLFLGMRVSARQVFEDVLQYVPKDVLALNSLGYAAMHDKNFVLALTYFDQVAELSAESSNAHCNQAFV